ncbi:sulfate ABC transporter permease subunit CysW [Paenibacillus sp. CCS19]|uniref:sulfate ABC transporter permease subunit CysW n=1 Tax=Paenibacillus sp. CCS19 TaxID=3158387 RepID=UPI0025619F35|nr:sulfate ABC transporter permease subunit CysW [Paenibacillus cellulosilyticus]GMK42573.1 sulfate ABC transporter permease subunit CysW [Paenibacillus cellulosilyticus]
MAGAVTAHLSEEASVRPRHINESAIVRVLLISIALAFLALVVLLPLISVLYEGLKKGWDVYIAALKDSEAQSALRLTLMVSLIAVPLNTIFGIMAAWAITKFKFRGRNVLITLIDLPFAISPVISGLIYVLLFGAQGFLGPWLDDHGIQIVYALPGIVLATVFVTFPFVARELIPIMDAQGVQEEEAAVSLGARGFKLFWHVTLPNIKWGLLYGIILCNARAMGEFGAVSVISGHIRGETNTLPLHIEILYNEYQFSASFAVASLLVMLALVTLVAKKFIEWRGSKWQSKSN